MSAKLWLCRAVRLESIKVPYTQSLYSDVPHHKRAYAGPVPIHHRMLINSDTPRPARIVAVRVSRGVIVQRDAAVQNGVYRDLRRAPLVRLDPVGRRGDGGCLGGGGSRGWGGWEGRPASVVVVAMVDAFESVDRVEASIASYVHRQLLGMAHL